MAEKSFILRSLEWLRAGYPTGVPREDYVALFGILHRQLTEDEIESIAGELAAQADDQTAVTEADVRDLIRSRVHLSAADKDISRVASKLAAGGWPLAGRTPAEEEAATDIPPSEGSMLGRIVNWLRDGYPAGVPEQDFIPLLALLKRRLTDAEVKKVAKALRKADVSPAGPEDIAAFISRITHESPAPGDLTRVRDRLTKKGWPVEFPDPDSDGRG